MSSSYSDLERPPLRADTLARSLVYDGSLWREVRVLATATSTNAAVAEQTDADEGLVVVAEHQTAGRGRLGREWESPPRAGLTFSVLLRPQVADSQWSWLPLLVGVAVAEGLHHVTEVDVQLKWPNDVLVGDRKLGGILVERHRNAAVVGVGINVTTHDDELPIESATSLSLAGAAVTDRQTLLPAVLRPLADHYMSWCAGEDSAGLHAAYTARCATLGKDVTVSLPDDTSLHGKADRVDESGRLVVVTDDGETALSSGDVVHLRSA